MSAIADPITLTLARSQLEGIQQLSSDLVERMHELLEKNTEGEITELEKSELETLVRISQFSQIVSMALELNSRP